MANTLVICDIQPEYSMWLPFKLTDFTTYLNRSAAHFGQVIYFYNGYDTLGMVTETDLTEWLMDHGLSERALQYIEFFDKGYGFLRPAIDNGIGETAIVETLRTMQSLKVWDSRKLPDSIPHTWALDENYCIAWNDSFDMMAQTKKPLIFVGGARGECLLELELGATALNLPYRFDKRFTY